jgi:hypothetical protein
MNILKGFSGFSDVVIIMFGFITVLLSIVGAFRSGALQHLRIGRFEIKGRQDEKVEVEKLIRSVTTPDGEKVPFETGQLASYYAQVLAQSKTSFWFSLVFASIGFCIIVLAAFMHSTAETGSTIARFIAGGVVDAVAALFFVQSKRAQESMADFFDKLRRDRNHFEARKLCESLHTVEARDALRVRLALHYAEVPTPDTIAQSIYNATLRVAPDKNTQPSFQSDRGQNVPTQTS